MVDSATNGKLRRMANCWPLANNLRKFIDSPVANGADGSEGVYSICNDGASCFSKVEDVALRGAPVLEGSTEQHAMVSLLRVSYGE